MMSFFFSPHFPYRFIYNDLCSNCRYKKIKDNQSRPITPKKCLGFSLWPKIVQSVSFLIINLINLFTFSDSPPLFFHSFILGRAAHQLNPSEKAICREVRLQTLIWHEKKEKEKEFYLSSPPKKNQAQEEMQRRGNFICVFPSRTSFQVFFSFLLSKSLISLLISLFDVIWHWFPTNFFNYFFNYLITISINCTFKIQDRWRCF